MRLRTHLLRWEDPLEPVDYGIRSMLGLPGEYDSMRRVLFQWARQHAVHKMMDQFLCNYVFFPLPEETGNRVLLIGPYLTRDLTTEEILELSERMGIPLQYARQMSDFYASLPVFVDTSMLMALVSTMGETLWGSLNAFETVDLNTDGAVALPMPSVTSIEENSLLMQMQSLQTRYDYENQMIEAVSRGLLQQVELLTSGISQLNFEKRMADPLRNMKNYCIICNTLLRKAAEKGGVHPLHIDRLSTKYALMIENKATTESCQALIGDMFRSYCRLVRTHTISHYSVPVQKALLYMEENLSGDLGLQQLADQLALAPSYLSGLFHRETGQTITEHANELRMKHAAHLLSTTQLQVQNIAQLCGIPDANYFTKLFKQRYSVTPRKFRSGLPIHSGPNTTQEDVR